MSKLIQIGVINGRNRTAKVTTLVNNIPITIVKPIRRLYAR